MSLGVHPRMREGDYYRWHFRPDNPSAKAFSPYWCKSRIALVEGGRLVDTYWGTRGVDSRSWSLEQARAELDLEFVANVADLVPCSKGVIEDHRPEDVVNLTHPNGGQCYLRKGAKRSMEVQRATWERKRSEAQRTADHYKVLLDREDGS